MDRLSRSPPSNTLVDYYLGTLALQFEIEWEPPEIHFGDPNEEDELEAKLPPDLLLPSPSMELRAPSLSDANATKMEDPQYDAKGEVRIDDNGNYWVFEVAEGSSSVPIFVPVKFALDAVEGNYVGVTLDKRGDGKRSGKISAVLSQRVPKLVKGTLVQDVKGNHWVKLNASEGSAAKSALVFIHPKDLKGAVPGTEVTAQLHERSDGKLSGVIVATAAIQEVTLEGTLSVGTSCRSHSSPFACLS